MPGPWSRTVSSPSRRRTSTTLPGGLHLAALSSRFATARSSRAGTPLTSAGSSSVAKRHARARAGARARPRAATSWSSRTSSTRGGSGSSSRASSTRSPTSAVSSSSWATRSRAQALAVAGVRRPAARQHLEVRAQRGERRAQLVRGVGDELALRALRALERLEHRVERASPGARPRRRRARRCGARGRAWWRRARRSSVSSATGRIGGPRRQPREHHRERDPGQREQRRAPSAACASARSTSVSGRATKIASRRPAAADVDAHVHARRSCGRRRTALACAVARPRCSVRVVRRAAAGRAAASTPRRPDRPACTTGARAGRQQQRSPARPVARLARGHRRTAPSSTWSRSALSICPRSVSRTTQ